MLDATAKPMPGILRGNLQQMGNYDECLNINAKVNGNVIEGKYCTAIITLKANKTAPLSVVSVDLLY